MQLLSNFRIATCVSIVLVHIYNERSYFWQMSFFMRKNTRILPKDKNIGKCTLSDDSRITKNRRLIIFQISPLQYMYLLCPFQFCHKNFTFADILCYFPWLSPYSRTLIVLHKTIGLSKLPKLVEFSEFNMVKWIIQITLVNSI